MASVTGGVHHLGVPEASVTASFAIRNFASLKLNPQLSADRKAAVKKSIADVEGQDKS